MPEDKIIAPVRDLPDKELVERIMSDTRRAIGDKMADFERCRRYRLIYQALDQADDVIDESSGQAIVDDKSKYSDNYLAIGAAIVDTAAGNLFNHFFSTPDYLEIEASNWEDELQALKITAHLKKRHKEMKFKTNIFRTIQAMLCFDYCVTLTGWEMRPGYVRKRVIEKTTKKYGNIELPYQDVRIETEWMINAVDRSNLEMIDYFSCAHDQRSIRGLEKSAFFVDWRSELLDDLKLNAETKENPFGKYKNIDAVVEKGSQLKPPNITSSDPVDRGREPVQDRVLVFRYWTPDQVVEVANEEVISRINLDGWPLQLWKAYELSSEFKGMGIVQRIERNQYDINAIMNIKRDFQNLQLTPAVLADEEIVGAHEGDIEMYSGKLFTFSGGVASDKMKVIQPGVDISQGSSEELGVNIDMTERVTTVSENAMGAYSKGRKTARETTAVSTGALSGVAQKALRLEEDCLEPIYQRQFLLEQTNMSQEEQFKYMGIEGIGFLTIRPEDYRWSAVPRFSAKGATYLAYKELHIQQFMLGMDRAMQVPQLHNVRNLFAKMWELLAPKDYLNFMKDPREKSHNVPPKMENMILAYGHQVEVSPENDHGQHIQEHSSVKMTPDYKIWPESIKMNLDKHIQQHQQMASFGQQGASMPNVSPGQDGSDVMRGMRGTAVA